MYTNKYIYIYIHCRFRQLTKPMWLALECSRPLQKLNLHKPGPKYARTAVLDQLQVHVTQNKSNLRISHLLDLAGGNMFLIAEYEYPVALANLDRLTYRNQTCISIEPPRWVFSAGHQPACDMRLQGKTCCSHVLAKAGSSNCASACSYLTTAVGIRKQTSDYRCLVLAHPNLRCC